MFKLYLFIRNYVLTLRIVTIILVQTDKRRDLTGNLKQQILHNCIAFNDFIHSNTLRFYTP